MASLHTPAADVLPSTDPSDEWGWLDSRLPQVTIRAVSESMSDFALPLDAGRDVGWLALSVRRVLALTVQSRDDDPATKMGPAQIRDNLRSLAKQTQDLWLSLSNMTQKEDDAILDVLFAQEEKGDVVSVLNLFGSQRDGLMTLFSILSAAANLIDNSAEKQSTRWRDAARRRLRVERAHILAPVFELAFGVAATGNDFPSGKSAAPSRFMDFYGRMVSLAFEERATPDLAAVVKEALKQHKEHPVHLAAGIVPGFIRLIA